MEDFVAMIVIILGVTAFIFGAASCDRQNKILDRDRSVKCYEQTQDKGCWGIR